MTAIYHALATRSDNAYSEVEVDKLCALIKDHNIIHFLERALTVIQELIFHSNFHGLASMFVSFQRKSQS